MKCLSRKMLAVAVLAACGITAQAADYQESRCQELRNSWGAGPVPNLEGQAALNLRTWVARCYPRMLEELLSNKSVTYTNPDGTTSKRDVYPVFGVTSMVPAAGHEGGMEVVISNPAGYAINSAAVTSPQTAPCDLPADYKIVAWCVASCYTPDQMILLPEGFEKIQSAHSRDLNEVVTLSGKATLDALSFEKNHVRGWTISPVDEKHEMVRIETGSGGVLKLTLNHPLVDAEGRVRRSDSFKVGEKLVRADGSFDPIVSIKHGTYFGKVYNVDVASADRSRNIVVAQGYLNGAVMYQNEGAKYLNRVLLRKSTARLAL